MSTARVVSLIGTIASLFAAVFWLHSSLIEVPDNIDTIVGELQRISRWGSYAAWAAFVAALCAGYGFACSTQGTKRERPISPS
jgi:hypothetical protein